MYVGGGAVDYEQYYLLGGLVVVCKNWRWAALVPSAARVAALASNNCLGPLDTALMITSDHEGTDSMTLPHTPHLEFQQLCDKLLHRLCSSSDDFAAAMNTPTYTDAFARSTQSRRADNQLTSWRSLYSDARSSLLNQDA